MGALLDLHNHLLPDVDDGCRSLEETLRYLASFADEGVGDVVFTPHLLAADLGAAGIDETLELHRGRFEEVRSALPMRPSPRIGLGQEILARSVDDVERVVDRVDVGLAGGDTLLVEFGFSPGFDGDGVIDRARASGRRIVVAHPERYAYGSDPLTTIRRWRERGALMQVNGGSLAGLYTARATALARQLLRAGSVDLVCGDHHGDYRPHGPGLIAETIEELTDHDRALQLMAVGPREALGTALPAA